MNRYYAAWRAECIKEDIEDGCNGSNDKSKLDKTKEKCNHRYATPEEARAAKNARNKRWRELHPDYSRQYHAHKKAASLLAQQSGTQEKSVQPL